MDVKNTQVQKGDIVDLTNAGLEEIKKYNNDYNDMSAPIPSNKRDWRTKDIANLWIGMIVSIAVYQVASGLLVSGMSWGASIIYRCIRTYYSYGCSYSFRTFWNEVWDDISYA